MKTTTLPGRIGLSLLTFGLSVCTLQLASALAAGSSALAADNNTSGVTSGTQQQIAPVPKQLNEQLVGITPQFGVLDYSAANGLYTSRAFYGFTADVNLAQIVNRYGMASATATDFFAGPEIGLLYSHIGNSSGSFFGAAGGTPGTFGSGDVPGANLAMIPLDLKVGWTMGDFRASIHGGGNAIYQSVPFAVNVDTNTGPGNLWNIEPNVGLDLEYGVPGGVGVVLRPDWTITGVDRMLALNLGVLIPIS